MAIVLVGAFRRQYLGMHQCIVTAAGEHKKNRRAAAGFDAAPGCARREKLAGLVAARAEIHTAIAATMPMGTMARDFAIQFLAAQECMDALRRNLRSEHVLIHEFLSTFYTQARG